ncbi:MAG TPA: hypothetical protein VGQ44_12465 [Gemmatimonadaceae bacterium]|jgi:hypothetical protein|nr:hypothetical protein [Gemmatimonadaceae bacterium]
MPATADLMMVMKELRVEKVSRALVRWDRIWSGALVVIVAAGGCIHSGPHLYGQYNDLAPKVAPTAGERTPRHLTVQLAKPANVAVFLVVPGRGSRLLFPQDSLQSQYVEAGSHLVETAAAANALSDTSRLTRLPPGTTPPSQPPQGQGQGRIGRQSGFARDTTLGMGIGFNQRGYLLIYASQQPLNYSLLTTRVAGISIPIDDDDALNTVWKLIRSVSQTSGPWAASASEFPP